MFQYLQKSIEPVARRINLIFSKAFIKLTNDTNKTQTAQIKISETEVWEDAERWQHYGITSFVPADTEALCLFLGGDHENGIVIATENKDYRPTGLKEGEVCLYTKEKDQIYFKNGNEIDLKTKTLKFNAEVEFDIETKTFKIKKIGRAHV